ncbi:MULTISPECIES: 5,6-dimethylbenzimidazole synthase [unclassified Thioalkalivibrio]|uniref:5,6-dimethylbenzimidazole synthase n=1 Tax=unclassified Thioalkalivibrio TaxID=2621013 RepID=UPI00037AEDD8|nr:MULTISPECIES: 5,6-dimethylbenzimidazole synthase [unclassified Thioalkalivibrio]
MQSELPANENPSCPGADAGGSGFAQDELAAVYRVIAERRDMRHFRPDPVDPAVLRRLLEAAHRAPSVGYMQPWRFLRITDPAVREALHAHAADEQARTAEACGERAADVHRLKLEGIREAGELLVVALTDGRERYVLGRRTLPEMDLCSAACAIQNLWLAARAEGLGMGWVSLFDPDWLANRLDMPEGGYPIAVLCLGHVERFYDRPMLETAGWDSRRPLEDLVFQDRWGAPCELAASTDARESAARPDGPSGGGDT